MYIILNYLQVMGRQMRKTQEVHLQTARENIPMEIRNTLKL